MYENTKQMLAGTAAPAAEKPLQRLPLAVHRVNSAVVRVGNFIDRFHGEAPAAPTTSGEDAAVSPYGIDLERLFSALERLENRLDALEAIG